MSELKRKLMRRALGALLVMGAAQAAARGAEPSVLEQVPADAYGMVFIGNVRTLANKVSNAATRLNLPMPPDVVGWATKNLGVVQGFDANSSAAVILLKPTAEREAQGYFSGMPPVVVLLPTADPKEMLANFKPGDADAAGIYQVSLPNSPEEKGYMAVVADKWVALAQKKEELAGYLARGDSFVKASPPEILKVFDNNDFVIWGNVEKLGAGADKWLSDQQINFEGMLELTNQINRLDPMSAALQKHFLNGFFGLAREFMQDASSGMITGRLTDSGATLGLVTDFKPASAMGKYVMAQGPGEDMTMTGLPAGAFLAAGAMRWNSAAIAPAYTRFMDQLFSDPAISTNERAGEIRRLFELGKQGLDLTQGARFVLLDPPAGGKNGLFCGSVLIDTPDPQKLVDLQMQNIRNAAVMQTMGPDFKQTYTVSPNAVTIKGVKLSRIGMKIELRSETAESPVPAASKLTYQMVEKIYGPEGITAYLGVVGKRAIMIYGSDGATMEAAVTAAQSNSEELAASSAIAATKDQIVAHPAMMLYLPVTRWVTLAQSVLKPPAEGEPAPAGNIANAPPVVVSANISGHLLTAEVHLPLATITGVQEAVGRLERALGGGRP